MSFIGAELFGLDDEPIYPSAYDYYRSPSLENARALLEDSGLYVPYEATRKAARRATELLDSLVRGTRRGPGASRGGGKRPRTRTSPAASASPPPASASDEFSIFQRADFLHDIHVKEFINPIIANRILSVGVQIPDGLRQRLREHSMSRSAGVYTKQATASLDAHFGLSASLLNVSEINAPEGSAAASIKRQHIVADAYMRDAVTAWLAPDRDGVAELVFDGILESPLEKPAKSGVHTETHLRSLATCAFLQWMIGEWPKPYDVIGPVREIRFLTGTFQTLDVGAHDAFLTRWIGYLRRDATALKSVGSIRLARIGARAVPSGTSGVALAPGDDSALIVHGQRVPFVAERTSPNSRRQEWPEGSEAELLASFLEISPARQVTYPKVELFKMFQYYVSLTPEQRANPRVDAVVQQVISVNSFRDAFKADVALARGAVYLTVDKLALVYYELRRRALGAPNRGLALSTSKDDDVTMELKTYRA